MGGCVRFCCCIVGLCHDVFLSRSRAVACCSSCCCSWCWVSSYSLWLLLMVATDKKHYYRKCAATAPAGALPY